MQIPLLLEEKLQVRITDLNIGHHLANDAILGFLHQGRVRLLNEGGWNEADVGGVGLIMRRSEVDYLAEAFLFDRLQLNVGLAMTGRARCRFHYRLIRCSDDAEKAIATAVTEMAFFDYARRRVARAPVLFTEWVDRINSVAVSASCGMLTS